MVEKEIINAEGESVGRIASRAAKLALQGKEILVVNCSKAVITGNKFDAINKYLKRRKLGGSAQRGPYITASSERIVKRIIRGMLPYKKGRGKEAFKKIKCYNEVPEEIKEKIKKPEKIKTGIEIKELSLRLKEK